MPDDRKVMREAAAVLETIIGHVKPDQVLISEICDKVRSVASGTHPDKRAESQTQARPGPMHRSEAKL